MLPSRRQLLASLPFAALAARQRPAVAQAGRQPVTFWFAQANADGQAALRRNLVEAFNASQDKYELQLEVKGAAVNNLLKVALVAGNGPDIVQTSGPAYLTAIATAGQVLALDAFAETYKWKERFLPALLNTSPTDYYPVQAVQMQRFKGETWQIFGEVMHAESS